ncbi:MAG: hypothetical protein JRC92_01585 [Deltaproteobacteria bacterium]|nr:hypothetical protein [Deltaproteobacteria bacterium]
MDKSELLKKGTIAQLKEELAELETKIRRSSDEVTYHSFAGMGIDKVDADATLQAAKELKKAMDERAELLAQIARLEG